MPLNSNVKGLSTLAGFGLLITAFVLAYLNATTSVFFWSMIYVAGVVVTTLAAASKFALALGVESAMHLDLMDEHGVVQAQAFIPLQDMEKFARSLLCRSESRHGLVN